LVLDVGETPRDRKVEKLIRVGSPATESRPRCYARLQDDGCRRARCRKRGGGWPGMKPRARVAGVDALKGNHGSMPGPAKASGNSGWGSKPWSRPSVRNGKPDRWNRHEGRKRETATAPDGGKASKCESRERCRETTLSARSGRDQTVMRAEPGRRIEPSRKAR
jgi:hypothetical protein